MRPTAAPEQRIEAGTVGDGTSASATGEGSAEITFVREGKLAIVVALDCGRCAGPTVLTAPERSTPLGEADGALAGSFLVDVTTDSDPEQSLWLQADGEWTIELLSWNDLPLTEGAVEGTGSTVIFFNGDSATSHVTWSPAHDTDMFQGRYFGVDVEDAYFFGDTEAFSEDIKMGLPGVLAIMTDGEWSVTPQ